MVMFHLHRSWSRTVDQTSAPGQSRFSKKDRHRCPGGPPSLRGFIESLEMAVHAIPSWRNSDDKLSDRRPYLLFCPREYCQGQQKYPDRWQGEGTCRESIGLLPLVHGDWARLVQRPNTGKPEVSARCSSLSA